MKLVITTHEGWSYSTSDLNFDGPTLGELVDDLASQRDHIEVGVTDDDGNRREIRLGDITGLSLLR